VVGLGGLIAGPPKRGDDTGDDETETDDDETDNYTTDDYTTQWERYDDS
jgi:hypothetical protein